LSADLAFARGKFDAAEAALLEARTVLEPTQRERWIANTVAALAHIAALQGHAEKAALLCEDASRRYALARDAIGLEETGRECADLLTTC
jgi:hypothetical protein